MVAAHLSKSALTFSAVITLGVVLSSCSNAIESAMSEGCDALPQMANAYAHGDRAAFDEVNDQASRVGFANFRGQDHTDDESLIKDAAVAANAYFTLYDVAYEPAESNNGKSVWRGLDLTPSQQQDVEDGLEVCEDY